MTTRHPAPFTESIVVKLDRLVRIEQRRQREERGDGFLRVLDPFAGVGRIHRLNRPGHVETIGVELEPEWADQHELTRQGSVFDMPRQWGRRFDVVATSPTYGNRFADHHTPSPADTSRRHGYAYDLGRMPSDGSSGVLPWGPRYWSFHGRAYAAIFRVVKPGGLFLLNVSNFVSNGQEVHAVEWHLGAAHGAGFEQRSTERAVKVATPRMGHGANHEARVDGEVILRLRRPAA